MTEPSNATYLTQYYLRKLNVDVTRFDNIVSSTGAHFVCKKNTIERQRFVPLCVKCLKLILTFFTCLSACYSFKWRCKVRLRVLRFHGRVTEDSVLLGLTQRRWVTGRSEGTRCLKSSFVV